MPTEENIVEETTIDVKKVAAITAGVAVTAFAVRTYRKWRRNVIDEMLETDGPLQATAA